jgi:hypothetical protein
MKKLPKAYIQVSSFNFRNVTKQNGKFTQEQKEMNTAIEGFIECGNVLCTDNGTLVQYKRSTNKAGLNQALHEIHITAQQKGLIGLGVKDMCKTFTPIENLIKYLKYKAQTILANKS